MMDIDEISTRKRKSLESGLDDLQSSTKRRKRANTKGSKSTSKKGNVVNKKANSKSSKTLNETAKNNHKLQYPSKSDEFTVFSAMDIEDVTSEESNDWDATVKRLSFEGPDCAVENFSPKPERSAEPLSNTQQSSPKRLVSSLSMRMQSVSPIATRRSSAALSPSIATPSRARKSPGNVNALSHPTGVLNRVAAAERRSEMTQSVSVAVRDVPAAEVMPVAMSSGNNPMWFTWLSGFIVLFFATSTFTSMSNSPKNVELSKPSRGESTVHAGMKENEPNLLLKNYSIPRFSEIYTTGSEKDNFAIVSEQEFVPMDSVYSLINSTQQETIHSLSTKLESTMLKEYEEFSVLMQSDIDTSFLVEVSHVTLQENEEILSTKQSFENIPCKEDFRATKDVVESLISSQIFAMFVENMSANPATAMQGIPTIFPPSANLAQDNVGSRVIPKESARKCVKPKKWNPFGCHRPLRTVNSHKAVTSSSDCYAFYLESEDSNLHKNSVTIKLVQPASTVYGFGLTHFLADEESSPYNVSCAPKNVSFTVFEQISSSVPLLTAPEDTEITVPVQPPKKKFQFPWRKNENPWKKMSPIQVPTNFDGFIFDPLGSDVTRSEPMVHESLETGRTVTQFFPLKTLHYPQYVSKVEMHIHSTQNDGSLACVYRMQVYGSVDENQ